jgi:hypothetical protein
LSGTDEIDPLTRLAIRHGCDKWGVHFYTPVYHELFGHLRERPLRMLEIGVGGFEFPTIGGASLRMWADYFPRARIVGIDILEKRLDLDPRVTVLQGSQDDPEFLRLVSAAHGPFDIIVDDGSHMPKHVLASFDYLFPALADGGLYVIEDVQTCFWPGRGGSPVTGAETMHLARLVIESLHHAEIGLAQPDRVFPPMATQIRSFRVFHNIFVIEKGDNTEPSSHGFRTDNAQAQRAMASIADGVARNPTPEAVANQIDVLAAARDWDGAKQVAAEALRRWPGNARVILATSLLARDSADLALLRELIGMPIQPDQSADEVRAMLRGLLEAMEKGA